MRLEAFGIEQEPAYPGRTVHGCRKIGAGKPRDALRDGTDIVARENMLLGSLMAGFGITPRGRGSPTACHIPYGKSRHASRSGVRPTIASW